MNTHQYTATKNSTLSNIIIWAVFAFAASIQMVSAQNGVLISAGTGTSDASSMLEVRSTTKGFLAPRMTQTERGNIASPAIGLLVYQTDNPSGFWYYSSTGWVQLSTGSGSYINNGTTLQSANFYISGYGYAGNFLQSPNVYVGNYRHTNYGNYENVFSNDSTEGGVHLLTTDNKSLGYFYANAMGIGINNGAGGWALLAGGAHDASNSTLDLRTNNIPRIFIDGTGNVGIGTSYPAQKLDVQGNVKLGDNIMVEGNDSYKVYRNLASYSAGGDALGAFVINTSQPFNSGCMFRVKVEGYFYDGTGPFETTVAAFMYTDSSFYNATYTNTGSKNLPVRLAKNKTTGNVAVILGVDTIKYQYPKLTVTSFSQGYGGISEAYADGWTISQPISLSNYSHIYSISDANKVAGSNVSFIQNQYGTNQAANFQISGVAKGGQVRATDWFRAEGACGLFFESYGGGWWMTDATWIRSYNHKDVYIDSLLEVDGGIVSGSMNKPGMGNIGFSGKHLKSFNSDFICDAASQTGSTFSWRGTAGYNNPTYSDYMIVNYAGTPVPGMTYGSVYSNAYYAKSSYNYYDIINDLDAIDHMHPLAQKNNVTQKSELVTDPESMPSFLLSKSDDGSGYYYDLNKTGAFAIGAVRQLRQETHTASQALEAKVERLEKIVEQLTGQKLGDIAFEQKAMAYKDVNAFAVIDARITKSSQIVIKGIANYEIFDQKDGSFMIRFMGAPAQDAEFTYSSSY